MSLRDEPRLPREQIRPCQACGGKLGDGSPFCGARITVERLVIDVQAMNTFAGTALSLGGSPQAQAVAEALTDGQVVVMPAALRHQVVLCNDCMLPVLAATEEIEP